MNRLEFKNLSSVINALVVVNFLASCGGMQSNPKSKYGEDKSAKPIENPTAFKPETIYLKEKEVVYGKPGVFVGTDYFKIKIDNDMEFTEGKESSINLTAIVRLPKVQSFALGVSGLPGAKIQDMRPSIPNTWKLTWTPPAKAVPESKNKKKFPFSIQVQNLKTEDQDTQKIINSVSFSQDFFADVFHYAVKPIIAKNDLPASINEDQMVNFSVWVDAPGAPQEAPPILQAYYDAQKAYDESTELITSDGYRYLVNPSNQGRGTLEDPVKGRWKFSYQLRAVEVPDQKMKKRMTTNEVAIKDSPTLNAMISFVASYGTQLSAVTIARFQIKRNLKSVSNPANESNVKSGESEYVVPNLGSSSESSKKDETNQSNNNSPASSKAKKAKNSNSDKNKKSVKTTQSKSKPKSKTHSEGAK